MKRLLGFVLGCFIATSSTMAQEARERMGGGYHCDDCGATVKVRTYFDANQNGNYNGWVDTLVDSVPVYLYSASWGIMGSQLSGRDDGSWVPGESDQGKTLFRNLEPGTYIVCSYVAHEEDMTEPIAGSTHPSPFVSVIERGSINEDESRWCYAVTLLSRCSKESTDFGWFFQGERGTREQLLP